MKRLLSPLAIAAYMALAVTAVVSTIFAFLLSAIGVPSHFFWADFIIATGIQFFIFSFLNQPEPVIVEGPPQPIVTETKCALCNASNEVPLQFGTENRYKCVSCKCENILLVSTKSTQASIIISKPEVVQVPNK